MMLIWIGLLVSCLLFLWFGSRLERRTSRYRRLRVEALESRTMLAVSTWTVGNGNFNVATNWDAGVPGVNDVASFTPLGGQIHNVAITQKNQVDDTRVEGSAIVTFSIGNGVDYITRLLSLDEGNLEVILGGQATSFFVNRRVDIGDSEPGSLILSGNGFASMGETFVGVRDLGVLTVDVSAVVAFTPMITQLQLGALPDGEGIVNVLSGLVVTGDLIVGELGSGFVNVFGNSGRLTSGEIFIGRRAQSTDNVVRVFDGGILTTTNQNINIGVQGEGQLVVDAGGVTIAPGAGGSASINVGARNSSGSVMTVDNASSVTLAGNLNVFDGNQLIVDNMSVIGNAGVTPFGRLNVAGRVQINGGATVRSNGGRVFGVVTLSTNGTWVAGVADGIADVTGTGSVIRLDNTARVIGDVDLSLDGWAGGGGQIQGNVRNLAGIMVPGDDGEIGVFTVTNDYHQMGSGQLLVDIGNGSADRLQVGGDARLRGQVNISEVAGFQRNGNQDFVILQASTIQGQFNNLREGFQADDVGLPELDEGWHWFVSYGDFDGDSTNQEVVLSVRQGVIVEPTVISPTSEDGTTTTFTIRLDVQPRGRVRVPLRITDSTEGLFVVVDRGGNEQLTDQVELVFDNDNWNVPQTVTVIGINDNIVDGSQDHLVEIGPIVRGDRLFRGLDPEDILITNLDNDGSTNSPPDAVDDDVTAQQGTATSISVLDNDTDPDDDDLTIISVTSPSNGTAVIDGDNILYTPNDGFSGSDSFEYTISDGNGGEDTATVTVTVNAVVGTPSLNVSDAEGAEDTAIDLDITADTTDPGDTLTITISDVPDGATLSKGTDNMDGTYTLTKAELVGLAVTPKANSADDFTLSVKVVAQDGNETAEANATINVTVNAVADTPSLTVSAASGDEDTQIPLSILAALTDNDGSETLSVIVSGVPTGASLSKGNDNQDGTFTLTKDDLTDLKLIPKPNSDENFTLTVKAISDEAENTSTAETQPQTLQVTINAVADAPSLTVQAASGDEDTAIPLSIAAALTDTDGSESLSYTISGVPSGATLSAGTPQGGGVFTLTPAQVSNLTITPAPNSHDDITLQVTATATESANNDTESTTANLQVTVNPVNDDPVADDDSASTQEFNAVDIDVLANDTDIDGDTLTITGATTPSNGTAVVNDNGTSGDPTDDFITYTPDDFFTGTDSFDYTISDGNGGTATATVTVNVESASSSFAAPLTSQTSSPTVAEEESGDTYSLVLQRGPKPESNGSANSQADDNRETPEPPGLAKKNERAELAALDEVLSGDLDDLLEEALA